MFAFCSEVEPVAFYCVLTPRGQAVGGSEAADVTVRA